MPLFVVQLVLSDQSLGARTRVRVDTDEWDLAVVKIAKRVPDAVENFGKSRFVFNFIDCGSSKGPGIRDRIIGGDLQPATIPHVRFIICL